METETEPLTVDTSALETEAVELRERAAVVEITTPVGYENAGAELVRVSRFIKRIVDLFEPSKKRAHEAHQAICGLEKQFLGYAREVEQAWKSAMAIYQRQEQEELRRQEAEVQAQLRREQEDRQIAQAEILEAQGHKEEAQAVLAQPVIVPAVRMERTVAAGVSTRQRWTYRIIDPGKITRPYLEPSDKRIRAQVQALGKDAEKVVGGIEVLQDTLMVVRSR